MVEQNCAHPTPVNSRSVFKRRCAFEFGVVDLGGRDMTAIGSYSRKTG